MFNVYHVLTIEIKNVGSIFFFSRISYSRNASIIKTRLTLYVVGSRYTILCARIRPLTCVNKITMIDEFAKTVRFFCTAGSYRCVYFVGCSRHVGRADHCVRPSRGDDNCIIYFLKRLKVSLRK